MTGITIPGISTLAKSLLPSETVKEIGRALIGKSMKELARALAKSVSQPILPTEQSTEETES